MCGFWDRDAGGSGWLVRWRSWVSRVSRVSRLGRWVVRWWIVGGVEVPLVGGVGFHLVGGLVVVVEARLLVFEVALLMEKESENYQCE